MKKIKSFESFDMNKNICDRCGGDTNGHTIMSMFNTDVICMRCKDKEKERDDYKIASDADNNEIKKGNYNFGGIGYEPMDEEVYLPNVSKKRKFPTYKDTHKSEYDNLRKKDREKWSNQTDDYFIYDIKKKDLGKYINTWFTGGKMLSPEGDIYTDEMITVKRVDDETANRLYGRKINPISISIKCPTGAKFIKDKKGNVMNYNLLCQIRSIDDSSFTAWFSGKPLEELKEIREKLMYWVNQQKLVNGEAWFDECRRLGADEDQFHYD